MQRLMPIVPRCYCAKNTDSHGIIERPGTKSSGQPASFEPNHHRAPEINALLKGV